MASRRRRRLTTGDRTGSREVSLAMVYLPMHETAYEPVKACERGQPGKILREAALNHQSSGHLDRSQRETYLTVVRPVATACGWKTLVVLAGDATHVSPSPARKISRRTPRLPERGRRRQRQHDDARTEPPVCRQHVDGPAAQGTNV
jgi:hypothetical protein